MIIVPIEHRKYLPTTSTHKVLPIGTVFGKLSINSPPFWRTDVNTQYNIFYECLCSCGQSTVASIGILLSNLTVSCGNCPRLCKICGAPATAIRILYCHDCYKTYRTRFEPNHKLHKESTPEFFLATRITSTKDRVAKNKRDFTITLDDIINLWYIQAGRCAITNLQMKHCYNSPLAVTIDRIDSKYGYNINNIQLTCQFANLAKNAHNNNDIIEFFTNAKYNNQIQHIGELDLSRTRLSRLCINQYKLIGHDGLIELLQQYNYRCAITELPLVTNWRSFYTLSIDRINSTLDYSIDNIQPVCQAVNRGKCAHTNQSIIDFFKLLRASP